MLKLGFDLGTDVLDFCGVYWYHNNMQFYVTWSPYVVYVFCRDPVCYVVTRHFVFSSFSITTQFVMSRQGFSSLYGNPCRDIEKSVATLFICVQFISVLRP